MEGRKKRLRWEKKGHKNDKTKKRREKGKDVQKGIP